MKIESLIRFEFHDQPFAMEIKPCHDLACKCTNAWIALKEVHSQGKVLPDALSFEFQVCVRTFIEQNPPKRSEKIESLVREFMTMYPISRMNDFVEEWNRQRQMRSHLESTLLDHSEEGNLVSYLAILHGEDPDHRTFDTLQNGIFFQYKDHTYLIDDLYCVNPSCDCKTVHLAFFEYSRDDDAKKAIRLKELHQCKFSLEGVFLEFNGPSSPTNLDKEALQALSPKMPRFARLFRQRYNEMKEIGHRSFSETNRFSRSSSGGVHTSRNSNLRSTVANDKSPTRVGRNSTCPCGSGKKFKYCCLRLQG